MAIVEILNVWLAEMHENVLMNDGALLRPSLRAVDSSDVLNAATLSILAGWRSIVCKSAS